AAASAEPAPFGPTALSLVMSGARSAAKVRVGERKRRNVPTQRCMIEPLVPSPRVGTSGRCDYTSGTRWCCSICARSPAKYAANSFAAPLLQLEQPPLLHESQPPAPDPQFSLPQPKSSRWSAASGAAGGVSA